MMKKHERPAFKAAIVFCILAIIGVQCTKPEQGLGIDLQDEDRLLAVQGIDTFTVKAYTLPEDSIRSDKLNPGMVGAYIDPVFGLLKAEHVTELRLSTSNPVFVAPGSSLDNLVIDSLILTLSFQSNLTRTQSDAGYGKFGAQYFKVFEITDVLTNEGVYYHTRDINYIDQDLVLPGSNMVTPKPFDSLMIGGSLALPQLRLPLQNSLGQRIISINGGSGLAATDFIAEIKGLYITVDESQFDLHDAGIVYFDTFTQLSRITMYYRNTLTLDTLNYAFVIRNNSGKFGRFQHDHALGAPALSDQVVGGVKEGGAQDLYVQAAGGTKVRVDLPHIENLRGMQGQAISRAVLTVPVRSEAIGIFPPPQSMFIFGINDAGDAFLLPDQIDGAQFVGGFFDPVQNHYRFNVTRYLQQVISDNREFNGFEIVSSSAAFSANRVVLNGPDYPDPATREKNMKLQIIFTKF